MKNRRNYYRVLHVQPEAPEAVIKASYRTLMQRLRLHPDLGGDHEAAALVNEAYATLIDPARRAEYDRTLRPPRTRNPAEPPPRPAAAARDATPAPAREHSHGQASCSFCGVSAHAADTAALDARCHACGCALSPAQRQHFDGDARRALGRLPRTMRVTFRRAHAPTTTCTGMTEDVSLNGMRFCTATALAVGERVRIDCDLCSAVAVVRSIRPDASGRGFEAGVEFLTLDLRMRRGGLVSVSV